MNPVSRITSRISVNFEPGKKFHRLDPSPHFTLRLAGNRAAARPSTAAINPSIVLRVISLYYSRPEWAGRRNPPFVPHCAADSRIDPPKYSI